MVDRIFLSFAGTDRDLARQLKHGLQDAGVEVWMDEQGIGWGEDWVEKLQDTLRQCAQDTRRTITRRQLLDTAGGDREAERILARLSGGRDPEAPSVAPSTPRLLVISKRHGDEDVGADDVDLAHEALLGFSRRGEPQWPRFREWIEAHRKRLEARDDLEAAAQAWDSAGKPAGGLARGGQLAYFAAAEVPSELAGEFLKTSGEAVRKAEIEAERQQQRELEQARELAEAWRAISRRWLRLLVVAVLLWAGTLARCGLSIILTAQANQNRLEAEEQPGIAETTTREAKLHLDRARAAGGNDHRQ